MSSRREWDHHDYHTHDFIQEHENPEELTHRKKIRKLLEDKLEKKRLRDEIDELDGEFDWDYIDRN